MSFSSRQFPPFPPSFLGKLRPEVRTTRIRAVGVFSRPPHPTPRVSLLFLFSPLSSPIVGWRESSWLARSSWAVGRSGISAKDRYKTFNGFETHSSTAAAVLRLFASFALPPPRPPTCVVGARMPTSEEQNQLWNARFYTSRRR